jgi:hypothetical protein
MTATVQFGSLQIASFSPSLSRFEPFSVYVVVICNKFIEFDVYCCCRFSAVFCLRFMFS